MQCDIISYSYYVVHYIPMTYSFYKCMSVLFDHLHPFCLSSPLAITSQVFVLLFVGWVFFILFGSVQFSCSVVSDSIWPQGLQHTRLPCPSPTPRAYSNSCPSNHLILCHPLLFLSSTFPSIRVFPMSQFFTSGGQSIGVSVSASVLPMTIQGWFPLGLTGLILQSKGLSRVFSNTTVQKHQFFGTQLSL